MELGVVVLFLWIPLAVAAGLYAGRVGRNPAVIVSILFSPLVAFVLLFAAGEKFREEKDEDRMPCPFCAEEIKITAIICPQCRSDMESPKALRAIQRRLQKESK